MNNLWQVIPSSYQTILNFLSFTNPQKKFLDTFWIPKVIRWAKQREKQGAHGFNSEKLKNCREPWALQISTGGSYEVSTLAISLTSLLKGKP